MPKPLQRQHLRPKPKRGGAKPPKAPAVPKDPCRLFAADNCKFGGLCKFAHTSQPPKKDGANGAKGKGKGGKGKKGGKNQGGVPALPVIPLLTPMTAFGLLNGANGAPADGSGDYPPPEAKTGKAKEKTPMKTRPTKSYWQQALSSLPGRAVKCGVALATCLSGGMQPENGTVPALAAHTGHHRWFPRKKYYLEYIGDTGAGAPVWSKKALLARNMSLIGVTTLQCGDGVRYGRWYKES